MGMHVLPELFLFSDVSAVFTVILSFKLTIPAKFQTARISVTYNKLLKFPKWGGGGERYIGAWLQRVGIGEEGTDEPVQQWAVSTCGNLGGCLSMGLVNQVVGYGTAQTVFLCM